MCKPHDVKLRIVNENDTGDRLEIVWPCVGWTIDALSLREEAYPHLTHLDQCVPTQLFGVTLAGLSDDDFLFQSRSFDMSEAKDTFSSISITLLLLGQMVT